MAISDKRGIELLTEIKLLFIQLVGEDRSFIYLSLVYGFTISLLTLAVPISVQMLVNSIAHLASFQAVITLSLILLFMLMVSAALSALQGFVLERFERRFYARITAEFTLRNIYADYQYYKRINRYELVNRYFDIMHVQKIIPSMVLGVFSIVLQMLVGVLLVSFYHPYLLFFNVSFVFLLWLIWRIWGYRALRTALHLSDAKYKTARHLEDVARVNDFFKSSSSCQYAIEQSDRLTDNYIEQRVRHFRNTFAQKISLLLLYAFSSAGLLGVGGVLVIQNELSLGQLVAAELILSAVFFGVSKLDYYLMQFYDLDAALEEIARVFMVPLENISGTLKIPDKPASICFNYATFTLGDEECVLNLEIHPGEKMMAIASSQEVQSCILEALKRYRFVSRGEILFGESNILDYEPHQLRRAIIVLDRPTIIECSVRSYLEILAPGATITDIHRVLDSVELRERIDQLSDGLDTMLTPLGLPLTASETLRLKIAGAWLANPQLLILNELFDTISYARRQRIFKRLCEDDRISLLYFSNRQDLSFFDSYVFIDMQEQHRLPDVTALRSHEVDL